MDLHLKLNVHLDMLVLQIYRLICESSEHFNSAVNFKTKDQDYRSAGVQEKVSKTISISGIPKTATMQQVSKILLFRLWSLSYVQKIMFLREKKNTMQIIKWLSKEEFLSLAFFVFTLILSFIDFGCFCGSWWCANAGHENKRCRARWDFVRCKHR